jgi:hypothetical protein
MKTTHMLKQVVDETLGIPLYRKTLTTRKRLQPTNNFYCFLALAHFSIARIAAIDIDLQGLDPVFHSHLPAIVQRGGRAEREML